MGIDMAAIFILGLLATPHCLGMCGPLVIAFPGSSGRFSAHLAYHAGRVLGYLLVGGSLAGIGEFLAQGVDPWGIRLHGVTLASSALAAAALLWLGLSRMGWIREPRFLAGIPLERLPGMPGRLLAAPGARRSLAGHFVLGALFGLLPCGVSWAVFAIALGVGDFRAGITATAWFALATVPGLLLLGTVASAFFRRYGRACETVSGLLMIWMGCRMAYRAIQAALSL